ncbi:MAG: MFS transporter [Coriobacteriia bacterium]
MSLHQPSSVNATIPHHIAWSSPVDDAPFAVNVGTRLDDVDTILYAVRYACDESDRSGSGGTVLFSTLMNRDYRLLWLGQGVSILGDQFYLVALPWLVLQLTGEPVQLGLVLAATGVPRALFMLVGGAWADRHSPRAIMLVSDIVRFAAVGYISVAALLGTIEMWQVYIVAVVFGTVSGFFIPAAQSAIPRLLEDRALERGNALMRIAENSAAFLGPAAAGVLIATFGSQVVAGETTTSLAGIGIAMAFDSATFVFSATCVAFVRQLRAPATRPDTHPIADIAAGLEFAWRTPAVRALIAFIALVNLAIAGTLQVGIPLLASTRLGGAAAFGTIISAVAGGRIVGMAIAGSAGRPARVALRTFMAISYVLYGSAMAWLSVISATWQGLPLLAVAGAVDGYVGILILSQLQRMTPKPLLGRAMGLVMLSVFGMMPLSQAIAGWIGNVSLTALFVSSAVALATIALFALTRPELRLLDTDQNPS